MTSLIEEQSPVTIMSSNQVSVLRDTVASQTTPHEVFTQAHTSDFELNGQVGSVKLPSARLVFVKYGGEVVVQAPPTQNTLVATVPFGPMGVSHKKGSIPHYRTQGFLLSESKDTIMLPDPSRGALVFAADPDDIARQAEKVLGQEQQFGQFQWLNRQALVESSLTHMCLSAWEMARNIPTDTPQFVVSRLLGAIQTNIINSFVLACDTSVLAPNSGRTRVSTLIEWVEAHVAETITVADLASAIGLSVRQLQATVAHHCGMSPLELVRDIRLKIARDDLCLADPDADTVARIAYSLGFNHLGRFSHHYFLKFGEKPSETLRRY